MRAAHTLLEMMTAVAVLATVLVITTQALVGGTGMRDSIASRVDSDEKSARLVKDVTQDLRYADINRIYLDANNSPSWNQSGSTGDFYSFKTCTGFATNQTAVTSMSRLIRYDEGIVLRYRQNPLDATKGQLSRTVYQLDSSGVTTSVRQAETIISSDLAWSYVNPDSPTVVRKGFEITQMANTGTSVTGNRLNVIAVMRPSNLPPITLNEHGIPAVTPVSTYSSSVFLRSTLFDQFGVLAPVITSVLSAQGYVGTPFRYDIIATNFPTSSSANPLPAGLSLDFKLGIISGIPTAIGTNSIVLTAQNQVGADSKVLTLRIGGPIPTITSAFNAAAIVGTPFSYQITATETPTKYQATGLPSGLTCDVNTGKITGTTTQLGIFSVALGATNSNGMGGATLTLSVGSAAPLPPVINSASTAIATINQAYSFQIQATQSPTGFTASGLPAGLSLAVNSGLISGTPTLSGTYAVAVTATNAAGTGPGTLTLTVQAPVPVVTSASLTGTVGTAIAYTIQATNSPTAYASSGNPSWLTAPSNSGVLSGVPTETGTFTVNVSATNASGTGTGTLTIGVSSLALPVITSVTTASATAGVLFSFQTAASNQPSSFSASNLPSWLTLNRTSGLLSGSPTSQGSFEVSLDATNDAGTGPDSTLVINVSPGTGQPTISFTANQNTNGTFQVTGTINAPPSDQIDTNAFAYTIPSGFTLTKSSWGSGRYKSGPLTFVVTGSTMPGGLITLIASTKAKNSGLTGTGTRNY